METKACDREQGLLYRSEFVSSTSSSNGLFISLRACIGCNGVVITFT